MGMYMVVRQYGLADIEQGEYHFFKRGEVVRKVGKDMYKGSLFGQSCTQIIKRCDVRKLK